MHHIDVIEQFLCTSGESAQEIKRIMRIVLKRSRGSNRILNSELPEILGALVPAYTAFAEAPSPRCMPKKLTITIYEVCSRVLAPYQGEECSHGMFVVWNAPSGSSGAIQCKDKINEEFYRRNEELRREKQPLIIFHVFIKERIAHIDPAHLVFEDESAKSTA